VAHIIELGAQQRLELLFSYPNSSNHIEPLEQTILHWFQLTLERDRLAVRGAKAEVRVKGSNYSLELTGPPELAASFRVYQERFLKLLDNGWEVLTHVIPRIKAEGRWDPDPETSKPYRPWRFFLPLGTALVHQRALQFFHYPPIRLLEECRDYLDDPVPARCEQLLHQNGVPMEEVHLYESIVDAVPIAAEDEQGSKWRTKKKENPYLIPIHDFVGYQKAQVELLLNPAPNNPGYTIPIVVYGLHPREIFQQLYGVQLDVNAVATAEILPGRKTPVLATNHPYNFYATAQGGDAIGSGRLLRHKRIDATKLMISDLSAARWQMVMAEDPSQDPQAVFKACKEFWESPEQRGRVEALVLHQGSLHYPAKDSLAFGFAHTWQESMDLVEASHTTDESSLA
jgi:hypothetical protein